MIKISSWNINGIRSANKDGKWDNFISKINPDIICLQEIKAKENQVDFLDHSYFKYLNPATRPGYSGTAILSKSEALSISKNINLELINSKKNLVDKYGDANEEGRVTVAEYEKFYVISVYTPNAKDDLGRLDFKYKNWDPIFLEYVKFLEKNKPVIITGDINVANEEIDLANPKANRGKKGFTDQEREGFKKILESGYADSFRVFNKEGQNYTWWSHFANSRQRNVGWRIDYILISNRLLNNLVSATIEKDIMGSDHCPISIELNI